MRGPNDSLRLRWQNEADGVNFLRDCTEDDRVADFDLKPMKIESEHMQIPEQQCKVIARLRPPCSMKEFGETMKVSAASIAKSEGELAEATKVCNEELVESIDMLDAIAVLSREMQKNPASFAQMDVSSADALVRFLSAVVSAAGFNIHGKDSLVALVQAEYEDDGAPAAAKYLSHSTCIVETLDKRPPCSITSVVI